MLLLKIVDSSQESRNSSQETVARSQETVEKKWRYARDKSGLLSLLSS